MKKRVIATCLLASSMLPGAIIRSQQEYSESTSNTPGIDWNSVSGVMWAQRNIATYVLTTQSSALGLRNYSGDTYVQDTAMAIASGGYNLFTTSNAAPQASTGGSNLGLGLTADDGPGSSYWAPGGLLSEWNPVPIVNVVDRGIPAVDEYPRDFSPGGLLVGFGEDSQFTPPNLLLAGGSQTAAPTLNPIGLALRGVSPETFGGVPASVTTAPVQSTVQTTEMVSTSAPTVLSSPAPVPSTSTTAAAPKQSAPETVPTPQSQTPVVSTTAPQTIATVAEAFMTTTVTSTSLSPAARNLLGSHPNLVAQSLNPLTDTPEPGSFAIMGLGFSLVAWKLRRNKQK